MSAPFGYEDKNETPQTTAIAIADAHLNNVGLPTYSELVGFIQRLNTLAGLLPSGGAGLPEYGKEARRLVTIIAGGKS